MAAISISALTNFFSDEPKSISRGENHYKSGHNESFSYSDGILRGSVQASMKNKSYKVTVSIMINTKLERRACLPFYYYFGGRNNEYHILKVLFF